VPRSCPGRRAVCGARKIEARAAPTHTQSCCTPAFYWVRTRPLAAGAAMRAARTALHCVVLAALVAAASGAFTCASSDNATICGILSTLYTATNGPAWLNKNNWALAAAGTATSYCTFFGIGDTNPCAVVHPPITYMCVPQRLCV
jgi:hypothetical protein